jgi:hypothetical protein
MLDHSIVQVVSHQLPTAVSQVHSHVRSCKIFGGQSDIELGFFQALWFPLPILIPTNAP